MKKNLSRLLAVSLALALMICVLAGCASKNDSPENGSETEGLTLEGSSWLLDSESMVYSFGKNGTMNINAQDTGADYYGTYTWDAGSNSGTLSQSGITVALSYDADNAALILTGEDGNPYALTQCESTGFMGFDKAQVSLAGAWDNETAGCSIVFDDIGFTVYSESENPITGFFACDGETITLWVSGSDITDGTLSSDGYITINNTHGEFVSVDTPTYSS